MLRYLSLIILLFGCILSTYAQKTTDNYGKVKVNVSIAMESSDGARAYLICGKDTLVENYKRGGMFYWEKVPVGIATCRVSADRFTTSQDTIQVKANQLTEKSFYLTDKVIELKAVVVKGSIPSVTYRGDTIRYNPLGTRVLEDDVARNILEQMTGVQVDENGVTIGGKTVAKTYVDGKKVFGEDPMMALNHLSATDVIYIYAYDEDMYKEQKEKFRKGEKQRVLNIETKSKLVNSTQADAFASAGNNLKKETLSNNNFRYGAGGIFNFFSEELLASVNLLHNNMNRATNQIRFYQSLKEPPRAYSENTFSGFSLSRRWEKTSGFYKELKVAYDYSIKSTEYNRESEQEYFPTTAFQERVYSTRSTNQTKARKHQMEVDFSMNDEKWGSFGFTHQLSKKNDDGRNEQWVNDNTNGKESGGTLRNNQRKESFFVSEQISWNKYVDLWNYDIGVKYTNENTKGDEQRYDSIHSGAETLPTLLNVPSQYRTNIWDASVSLSRSLSREKYDNIAIDYAFNTSNNKREQTGWDTTDPNIPKLDVANTYYYKDRFTTHRTGVRSSFEWGDVNLGAEMGWEHAIISLREVNMPPDYNKHFNSCIASLGISMNRGASKDSYRLAYDLSSQSPSGMELRPLLSTNNPYFLYSGNPDLQQSKTHKIMLEYNHPWGNLGNTLSSKMAIRFMPNSISRKTTYFTSDTYLDRWDYNAQAGSSLSSYENMNNAWDLNWMTVCDFPLVSMKSTMGFMLNFDHRETPYYYNSERDKTTEDVINLNYNFRFNRIPNISTFFSGTSSYFLSRNEVSQMGNKVFAQSANVNFNWQPILKYFFINLSYSFNFQKNYGYASDINRTHMLNTYLGCKLFKRRAELSFTAYDLLNSYNPHSIKVNTNYINNVREENFGRYFTFNFSWNLRKIKSNRLDVSRGVSM